MIKLTKLYVFSNWIELSVLMLIATILYKHVYTYWLVIVLE